MTRILLLAILAGCSSAPWLTMVTDVHYEPDTGCGGGFVETVCQVRRDGSIAKCWTGPVEDFTGLESR